MTRIAAVVLAAILAAAVGTPDLGDATTAAAAEAYDALAEVPSLAQSAQLPNCPAFGPPPRTPSRG